MIIPTLYPIKVKQRERTGMAFDINSSTSATAAAWSPGKSNCQTVTTGVQARNISILPGRESTR